MPKPRRLAAIPVAAESIGVQPITIRRRIADGTLPAFRVAGTRAVRVDLNDVDKLLERIPAGVMHGA